YMNVDASNCLWPSARSAHAIFMSGISPITGLYYLYIYAGVAMDGTALGDIYRVAIDANFTAQIDLQRSNFGLQVEAQALRQVRFVLDNEYPAHVR
ncbi:MAG: hypothetical protein ACXVZJ_14300, partial [Terriglobales bacterium]